MLVKVKKTRKDAVIPHYAKLGDAGLDLTAVTKRYVIDIESADQALSFIEYGTGLAFEIPEGYVGLIFPRSSLSNKGLMLTNHVGVVDSGYRGEVKFRFKRTLEGVGEYQIGDRVGQMIIIPYPKIELQESDMLNSTERGTDGFGSTK